MILINGILLCVSIWLYIRYKKAIKKLSQIDSMLYDLEKQFRYLAERTALIRKKL